MKTTWLLVIVVVTLAGIGSRMALTGDVEPTDLGRHRTPVYAPGTVAANGVVEGAQPEIALRPEMAGTIATICFRENQEVSKGSLLVELRNETQKQHVALAEAEVAVAQAQLDRLRNGERMERRKALAAMESAKRAVYLQTKAEWERSQRLTGTVAVTREQYDADYHKMLRAQAELEQASADVAFVEAPPRADELAAAEGTVAAAEARLRLAQAELAKTRLTAPSNARILRVYAEPGELTGPTSPQPVLLLADLSKRRVRAFVEELDAPRVEVGQSATVTADGLPDREFPGIVTIVMPRMGKRALQTDAPEEYKDLFFREVLIDLDGGEELMLNLRVKARIKVH